MASRQKNEGSLDPVFVLDVLKTRQFKPAYEEGLGHGYAVWVGHGEKQVGVGVFPDVKAVQVVSGTSILRLDNVQRVKRRAGQLHLEAVEGDEQVSVDIASDGGFVLRRRPLPTIGEEETPEGGETREEDDRLAAVPFVVTEAGQASEVPEAPQPPKGRRVHKERRPETQDKSTHTRQLDQPEPAATPSHAPEATENERKTVRGRVGSEVRFRTTARRNLLVASFPLGEHPDLETTVWHSIVVFGDRAEKLREKGLSRGQEIEVVGYIHERDVTTKEGQRRTIQELYATAIRTTLRKPADNSSS